jgi:MFS family permease
MTSTSAVDPDAAAVAAATRATYAAFIGSGFAFASWASRIPQVKDHLHLDPSALGLLILSLAAGSILSLPLSGPVIAHDGSRRTVTAMAVLLAVGLGTVSTGYLLARGEIPVIVVGLFLVGFGNGAWDVAMNLQGALVEQRLGRSIMSRFHAGFSGGTVIGALVGAIMIAVHVPVSLHLGLVAVVVGIGVPLGARAFIPDRADRTVKVPAAGEGTPPRRALAAWREPRTLLIGVFVLAFAFAEGTGNDWISVAMIEGHHVSAAVGSLTFAAFLVAMTTGRWFGPGMLDRFGRVPTIRALSILGISGVVLFSLAPFGALSAVGAMAWGVGVSLGFPVGMSAGSDDPSRAAGRVSAIASIGYCAFLAGPPSVGFLGDHVTVIHAVLVVAGLLTLAALISGNTRPPESIRYPRSNQPDPAAITVAARTSISGS